MPELRNRPAGPGPDEPRDPLPPGERRRRIRELEDLAEQHSAEALARQRTLEIQNQRLEINNQIVKLINAPLELRSVCALVGRPSASSMSPSSWKGHTIPHSRCL